MPSDRRVRLIDVSPQWLLARERRAVRVAPLAHQAPPDGDWSTWLLLGGRGAGKTWAGARWLSEQAERGGRFALVGPSLHDVREVMIDGLSGLRAFETPGMEISYAPSRRRLSWGNGSEAYAFSAEDPDSLRGPQFAAAWADEFCAWRNGGHTLALLRMGLRLGVRPRLVLTTTPKPTAALRALLAEPGLARSGAGTAANAEHLAPAFLETLTGLYGGTRLAAQELDGLVTEDEAGALWRAADLARCRGLAPARFERVVVAVDPPATAGGDACGIVAAGREDGRAYVLADRSAKGLSPMGWAERVIATADAWGADRIVAETNQGGDMVREVLQGAGCRLPVHGVHASRSKRARAEPVAALYEQGRVTHCGDFPELEEELMGLGAESGASPDRADALVWAVSELMLGRGEGPRVRVV